MTDKEKFDELTKAIAAAHAECERLHTPWAMACSLLKALERERNAVWDRLLHGVIQP